MKNLIKKLGVNRGEFSNPLQEIGKGTDLAGRILKDYSLNYSEIQNSKTDNKSWSFDSLNRFLIPKKTALSMLIPLFSIGMPNLTNDYSFDKSKNQSEYKVSSLGEKIFDSLIEPNSDKDITLKLPYWTNIGRYQRTARWDEEFDEVENKYDIPKGTVKAIAMQESYGIKDIQNKGLDGGAGIFQFSPGTGRAYGLSVKGNSEKTGADYDHGRRLSKWIKNNDYKTLKDNDERLDPKKSAWAAGEFLKTLKNRYGGWDEAIESYNQGSPSENPSDDSYVEKVKEFRDFYNKFDSD